MRSKEFYFSLQALDINHPIKYLAFGDLAGGKNRIHTHIPRKTDICFTLVYDLFARQMYMCIGEVLFKSWGMSFEQYISSDCLKMFFS